MLQSTLSVREMALPDINHIIRYWTTSDENHLRAMGVEPDKLPSEEQFHNYLSAQLQLPIEKKEAYCIIWLENGEPVGHSNTRPTHFGEEAFMHLHLWNSKSRSKGLGLQFVRLTLPCYFNRLQLQRLYCEPYALNPAPNKTIEKAGFTLVAEQVTTPGAFNFEPATKRWVMTAEQFKMSDTNQ